jgi:hypothetical protein
VRVLVRATNGTAEIAVADSGPGVPPDVLARLFEPFFSLKADGTGLGLAIARRTVEAHGGQIHAENVATGGLTVRIALPQTATREAAAGSARFAAAGGDAETAETAPAAGSPATEAAGARARSTDGSAALPGGARACSEGAGAKSGANR